MAKFCGKCGSPLDEFSGQCPYCNGQVQYEEPKKEAKEAKAPSGKKAKNFLLKLTAVVLSLLIVAGAVVFVLAYFGKINIPIINRINHNEKNVQQEEKTVQTVLEQSTSIKNLTADKYDILINETTDVLFTVKFVGTKDDNVDIILENENGEKIGNMHDDGVNGDVAKDDNIFSIKTKLSSADMRKESYRASYSNTVSNTVKIFFYRELSQEEHNSFYELTNQINSFSTIQEAEEFIKQSPLIESYEVKGNRINYKAKSGMKGVFEVIGGNGLKGSGSYCVPDKGVDYDQAEENLESFMTEYEPNDSVLNGDTIAIRPFRSSGFDYDDFKDAGELLSTFTGGTFDCIDDSSATVERMKSFDDYKFVLIDSHGTLSDEDSEASGVASDNPYMLTGERYSNYSTLNSADWLDGRIVVCGINSSSSGIVAVGSGFFDRYYESGSLNGSVFFLGTCFSMHNDSIAQVLEEKGAEVVYGFDEPVTTTYCNEVLYETVINSMILSASSAKEAFDETCNIYGALDPYNTDDCKYLMYGSEEYVIAVKKEEVASERDVVLVLDVSGSMGGEPLDETKKAATRFIEAVLKENARVAIVVYDSYAEVCSDFSTNEDHLLEIVDDISAGGGTNIDSGLVEAKNMLDESKAKKKIIVLMSDGQPNEGRTGTDLINFAKEIKDDDVYLYTLGFFKNADNKAESQKLMEQLASEGGHYEVSDADDLKFFFGDIADQISGQKYIYVRIACPVDVTVNYNGEVLTSEEDDLNTRTGFGTLTLEDIEDSDDKIKTLRLKAGVDYDIKIEGTGKGKMDYTIGFMDDDGDYSDMRRFKNIAITKNTVVDTSTEYSGETILNVDEDGDGKYDLKYRAGENGRGEIVDYTYIIYIAAAGAAVIILLIMALVISKKIKKKRKVV